MEGGKEREDTANGEQHCSLQSTSVCVCVCVCARAGVLEVETAGVGTKRRERGEGGVSRERHWHGLDGERWANAPDMALEIALPTRSSMALEFFQRQQRGPFTAVAPHRTAEGRMFETQIRTLISHQENVVEAKVRVKSSQWRLSWDRDEHSVVRYGVYIYIYIYVIFLINGIESFTREDDNALFFL